jgi:ribose 5-phosphate isomerase B
LPDFTIIGRVTGLLLSDEWALCGSLFSHGGTREGIFFFLTNKKGYGIMIAVGCDHGGFALKKYLVKYLEEHHIRYKDFGTFDDKPFDYPDAALPVAKAVAAGECERGVLLCGTGVGMSIAANKVDGIRASLCHDVFTAKMTRKHNDSNILTCGERVIGPGLFLEILDAYLTTPFEGGRHAVRVDKITAIEKARR